MVEAQRAVVESFPQDTQRYLLKSELALEGCTYEQEKGQAGRERKDRGFSPDLLSQAKCTLHLVRAASRTLLRLSHLARETSRGRCVALPWLCA